MKKKWIFWGIFFIAAAVFLIISQIGLFGELNMWSLLFTILLIACIIGSIMNKSFTGVLFSLAFLCIIYANPLGISAITPWPVLGAALLGSIGCELLFHSKRKCKKCNHHISSNVSIETVEQPQFEFKNSFSENIKYVNSNDFQSASIKCSFGAMKVYFDNATIKGQQAVIDLNTSFCSVTLYFPKSWKIVNNIKTSFGGVNEKNKANSNGIPTILLTGAANFSGIEIVYI